MLLDAAKAFDRVNYTKLFTKEIDLCIRFRRRDCVTTSDVPNGVKQRSVLFSFLFW